MFAMETIIEITTNENAELWKPAPVVYKTTPVLMSKGSLQKRSRLTVRDRGIGSFL